MCIYSPMPHTLSYCALIGKCALIRSNTVVIVCLPELSPTIICSLSSDDRKPWYNYYKWYSSDKIWTKKKNISGGLISQSLWNLATSQKYIGAFIKEGLLSEEI